MINRDDNPEYLNSFLDYSITILNKSPNSIKEYNYDIAMFLKFIKLRFKLTNETDFSAIPINDIPISEIQKIKLEDIHAFISYMATTLHSKPATRARKCSSIRIFFKYLSQKEKLIENNPAQNLETPKKDKRMPKYLSLDESKKLLSITSNDSDNRNEKRDYAIITIFLNCGIRLSELVGINIKDITFSECKLNVIGKGNKERTIYLNKACINAINAYLADRPREGVKFDSRDALFLSEQRRRISNRTVQYVVKEEMRIAGIDANKYSVHKLRHTAATLMYKYGNVDIRSLQNILGHENISTTQIYTHVDDDDLRDAVKSNPLANI